MRGRIHDFLLGLSRLRSTLKGESVDVTDAICIGCCDMRVRQCSENRSGPGVIRSRSITRLSGDDVFLVVPLSSSDVISLSSSTIFATESGSGGMETERLGKIEGPDMFPTHSTDMTGASMSISCINKPRTL
jgi:hypothetical protein